MGSQHREVVPARVWGALMCAGVGLQLRNGVLDAAGRSCPAQVISGPIISAVPVGRADQTPQGRRSWALLEPWLHIPAPRALGRNGKNQTAWGKIALKMQFLTRSTAEEVCSTKCGISAAFNPFPSNSPAAGWGTGQAGILFWNNYSISNPISCSRAGFLHVRQFKL